MVLSISLIFVALLILPAIFIIWLTKRNYKSKIDWVFQFLFYLQRPIYYLFSTQADGIGSATIWDIS